MLSWIFRAHSAGNGMTLNVLLVMCNGLASTIVMVSLVSWTVSGSIAPAPVPPATDALACGAPARDRTMMAEAASTRKSQESCLPRVPDTKLCHKKMRSNCSELAPEAELRPPFDDV